MNNNEFKENKKHVISMHHTKADFIVPNGNFPKNEPGVVITVIYRSIQTKLSKIPLASKLKY